jgi:hypothetical protein
LKGSSAGDLTLALTAGARPGFGRVEADKANRAAVRSDGVAVNNLDGAG